MILEWQTNPPEELMNWDKAMEYAGSLGDGWRLPTRAELVDAYDNEIEGFKKDYYWSSSTYTKFTSNAYYVNFDYGNVFNVDKDLSYYVRCVRENRFTCGIEQRKFMDDIEKKMVIREWSSDAKIGSNSYIEMSDFEADFSKVIKGE